MFLSPILNNIKEYINIHNQNKMLAYKMLDLLRLPCVITKGNSHKSFQSTNQKVPISFLWFCFSLRETQSRYMGTSSKEHKALITCPLPTISYLRVHSETIITINILHSLYEKPLVHVSFTNRTNLIITLLVYFIYFHICLISL